MKIYEFRIILPISVEKYNIANRYMTAKRTRETASNGEGLEIIKNEPFQKGDEKGQYTYKIMHFKSKIPPAIRWAFPDKYLHAHEKSYNAYPHFYTTYEQPGMGKNFYFLVESKHIPYTTEEGVPDNLLGLNEDELKIRKVIYLDIVNSKPKPEKKEWDLHNFECQEAGINRLETPENKCDESKPPEWTTHYKGTMMVAVKVIKFRFHLFGVQTIAEAFAKTVNHDVFLDSHRAMFCWAKEWYKLNLDDIKRIESEVQQEQKSMTFERDDDEEEESCEKKNENKNNENAENNKISN